MFNSLCSSNSSICWLTRRIKHRESNVDMFDFPKVAGDWNLSQHALCWLGLPSACYWAVRPKDKRVSSKKKKKIKRQSSDKNKKYFPFSIQMTELKIDLYILYISSPNVGAFLKKMCCIFIKRSEKKCIQAHFLKVKSKIKKRNPDF